MKQFKTILNYELKGYFKNKIFVGVTVFFVFFIAVVMMFPRLSAMFESSDASGSEVKPIMLISADENALIYKQSFEAAFADYTVELIENKADIEKRISSGDAECAFAIDSEVSYTYYVNNLSMYDMNSQIADEIMQNVFRANAMIGAGLSANEAGEILSAQITHETQSLGKDQMQNFFYTYIMIFALYMVILLYGQMVATNVATEKSSRAMEVLITSVKPTAMMFGKVISSCIAGFLQIFCIFGSAILFYNLNKEYWTDHEIVNSIFDMPPNLLMYMLLFFVLGFLIYAFMYGAIGSTVSKLEDINTAVMPITLLFIIAFFVVMFSMSSGNIENIAMKICSFIPFTSPMAMFTRIAMSHVEIYEIIISVVILIASVFGVGVLSAKIYRVGVLLYGTKPKLSTLLKSIRKS